MGACAEVVDAHDLPASWDSPVPLSDSTRNLYGCMPHGLNGWELQFANWLDRQERVLWWTRNLPRPNAADDWSVRIVLPETGRGFYPDFVICVDGRKQPQGIGLAETKERIESNGSGIKSRTEHREYGRALMLTYDVERDRFLKSNTRPRSGATARLAHYVPMICSEVVHGQSAPCDDRRAHLTYDVWPCWLPTRSRCAARWSQSCDNP